MSKAIPDCQREYDGAMICTAYLDLKCELADARAEVTQAIRVGGWKFSSRPLYVEVQDLIMERDKARAEAEKMQNAYNEVNGSIGLERALDTLANKECSRLEDEVKRLRAAIEGVGNQELFNDGPEADLFLQGIDSPAEAYMLGREDAINEVKEVLGDALKEEG